MRRRYLDSFLYGLILTLMLVIAPGCGEFPETDGTGEISEADHEAGETSGTEPGAGETAAAEPAANGRKPILEVARESGKFTQFLMAVERTELAEMLDGEGPYTVFAPGDDAFDLLSAELLDQLFEPQQRNYLTRLLSNHIVEGELRSTDKIGEGEQRVETLAGSRVKYVSEEIGFYLEAAEVKERDLEASNGVLHRIDRIVVLRPD